nr:ABC transporter permease [Sedimentibacter sp.]
MRSKFNFKRFMAIMKKEFLQISVDKISLRMPIFMTVGMMLLFGYAVNTDVDRISTVVFDQSKTQESREFIDQFKSTGYFVFDYDVNSFEDLNRLIDKGKAKAGLIIPSDYAVMLKKNKSPQPQLVIDGTDPTVARTALNSGVLISNTYSINQRQKFMEIKGFYDIKSPGIDLNTRVRYNPNMSSNVFSIPGLVGLILQNITIMLTAFAMVREKERGTIEQLIVTPVKSNELILGKLIPYITLGYASFLLALVFCRFWFKVEIQGNIYLLLGLGMLFVLCSLSIGMLISIFAKNQLQAMQFTIVIILPSVLISGFMFPIEAMPNWIKVISMMFPLSYFLRIDRSIILKGVGIGYIWQDSIALVIFLMIIFTIAVKKFKKNLD